MDQASTVTEEELGRERWASVAIMVLLPLPAAAAALWLSRQGHPAESWILLAVAGVLECFVAVERILVMRGMEGLAWIPSPAALVLRWGRETIEIPWEAVREIRLERSFLGGRPRTVRVRTLWSRYRVPWFAGARNALDALAAHGHEARESRPFPVLAVSAGILLVAAGAAHIAAGFPAEFVLPGVLFAFMAIVLAYPYGGILGPRFRLWDHVLAGAGAVGGAAACAAVLMAALQGGFAPSLPPSPGRARTLGILSLASSAGPRSRTQLLELAGSPRASDRRDAVQALALRDEGRLLPVLRPLMRDPDAEVRRAVAYALGGVPGPAPRNLLLDMMAHDEDMTVVREANRSLERQTGVVFRAGASSRPLGEKDRVLLLAFWVSALRG